MNEKIQNNRLSESSEHDVEELDQRMRVFVNFIIDRVLDDRKNGIVRS